MTALGAGGGIRRGAEFAPAQQARLRAAQQVNINIRLAVFDVIRQPEAGHNNLVFLVPDDIIVLA
ncbi:MAG: hypothetical protein FWE98_02615 [Oscillospiraceae bacterium]|nr:hypothetical protein [Oscillospiraceae bacterium]